MLIQALDLPVTKLATRESDIDAISARDPPIAKVPRMDTMNPYTTEAGPPFRNAAPKRALVASQVDNRVAEKPRIE